MLNYTTTIAADKTAAEIGILLAKAGAASVSTEYQDGKPVGVGFTLATPHGPRRFDLPVNIDGVHRALKLDRRTTPRQRERAQAERTAWRVMKVWVEAQVALIEAQMATLDQAMLPYLVVRDDGATLYATYREREQAAVEAGS